MRPIHIALMLLVCTVWGFNFVVSKIGVNQFPPLFFASMRFMLLGVVLLPWLKLRRGQMWMVLQIAVYIGALHFALMFTAIDLARDMSVIAIVVQLGTPISVLMAWLLLGETFRWRRGLGIALSFVGMIVMSFDPAVMSYGIAVGACLFAVVSMAYGQILIRRIRDVDAMTMQAWIGAISGPVLLLLSLIFETGQIGAIHAADWTGWSAMVYSSIGVSLVGHSGAYYLLRNYPVAVVNPGLNLAPIFGVAFSILYFGEVLSNRVLFGAALTVIGVFIVTFRESQLAARNDPAALAEVEAEAKVK